MDFILGAIVGSVIALGFVALFLMRSWSKPEQPVIDEMTDYLEVISLPYWSNGATRNWLENQLQIWKKTRKNSRGAHTDAQLLVHLFLELGRDGEDHGTTHNAITGKFKLNRTASEKWKSLQNDGAEQEGIAFRMNGEGGTINGGRIGVLDTYGRVEWVELGSKDGGEP